MSRTLRYPAMAAFISYLLAIITVVSSSPIPTGAEQQAPVCLTSYQPSASASSECTSTRFYYSTLNNTCSVSHTTCINDYNVTYPSMEDCELACNDTTTEPTNITLPQSTCTLPSINNGYAQTISCTDAAQSCSVYYVCNKPYELYPAENRAKKIECTNGVWEDHEVYCTKMEVAVMVDGVVIDEDPLDTIVVSRGAQVTIGCQVKGMDDSKYNLTWTFNDDMVAGQTVDSNGVAQVAIESVEETHEGTYTCSVTGMMDKDIEVKLEVEDEVELPKPTIIQFQAHITGSNLAGFCACQGSPKPDIEWTVNGDKYTNEFPANSLDTTLSLLNLPGISAGTHDVTCECRNDHGTVLQSIQLEASGSKKKRSLTTSNTNCELEQNSVIVSGKLLRSTESNHHLKINDIILRSKENRLNLQSNDVIRTVKTNSQRLSEKLQRNRQLTLKLTLSEAGYSISDIIPHDSIPSNC